MAKQALKTALAVAASTLACVGAAHAGTYAQTQYPIVLAHGMAGFSSIGGIDYFYGVPQDLRSNGAKVYSTSVSAFNSAVLRGEQLLTQVEDIAAISGAKKVNLIGHSQGNQSIRYVAAVRPDLVASVTSVGGVTFGSPVADLIQGLSGVVGPTISNLIASVVNALGSVEALLSGNPSLPQNALEGTLPSLTTSGAAACSACCTASTTACRSYAHWASTILPSLPKVWGHVFGDPPGGWGLMGNQQFGDCVMAGAGHEEVIWHWAGGKPIPFAGSVPTKTPLSEAVSKALKKRGFKFVGPVIVYAWMQAVGIVDDHIGDCHRAKKR